MAFDESVADRNLCCSLLRFDKMPVPSLERL